MLNYLEKSKIQLFFRGKKINKSSFLHYIDNFILYKKKYFIYDNVKGSLLFFVLDLRPIPVKNKIIYVMQKTELHCEK